VAFYKFLKKPANFEKIRPIFLEKPAGRPAFFKILPIVPTLPEAVFNPFGHPTPYACD
jgi:hypothetical protein